MTGYTGSSGLQTHVIAMLKQESQGLPTAMTQVPACSQSYKKVISTYMEVNVTGKSTQNGDFQREIKDLFMVFPVRLESLLINSSSTETKTVTCFDFRTDGPPRPWFSTIWQQHEK